MPGASNAPSVEPLLRAFDAGTPSQHGFAVPAGVEQVMTTLADAAAEASGTTAGSRNN